MLFIDSFKALQVAKLRFYAFHHPYVCTFIEAVQKGGLPKLFTLANQSWHRDVHPYKDSTLPKFPIPGKGPFFQDRYNPGDVVATPYPQFNVDFDLRGEVGSYAQYNWELFFHIPLFVATRLMQDERHEEAMQWFHHIFNPTTASKAPVPQRYWFCKPLRDLGKPEAIKLLLQQLKPVDGVLSETEEAIEEWRDHPFEPHRIARRRPGAYQKTVVMSYLDNLIAWGDKLFRRDTIESINEATQLYVLAARILGAAPYKVPELGKSPPKVYADLRKDLDAFSNAIVWIESKSVPAPFMPALTGEGGSAAESGLGLPSLYFCIPHNDKLQQYWDTVADRLFKIRHCMNIEGIVRELPLFEPPIDPALLVRARAMGLDLASVLDDLSAPTPHYRFTFMLQKAREFCEELKQLGSLALASFEKRDAEQVALIRAGHEKALLEAVREVKRQQIKEAEHTLASLQQARAQGVRRQQYYSSRAFTIAGEKEQLDMLTAATVLQTAGQSLQLAASLAHTWPDQFIGPISGPVSGAVWLSRVSGGTSAGPALQTAGRAIELLGGIAQARSTASGILAGHRRRADDWKHQADLATTDVTQIDKQIAAAEIRRDIAERDLANHELQIEHANAIDDFLRAKFTNQDLFGWMCSQVSAVYFQAYQLTYDLCKRVERLYRLELGIEDSNFIQFGRWDTLRKGLLAGERLSLDLRRLEAAYLEQNRRPYELTKHVSLALLDPHALTELRETGTCEVVIPEELFDLDYPGHYIRRIKSVSLTIPSVTGPYTSVSCTLTLLKHTTRTKKDPIATPIPEFGPVQSIATSGGRNDTGLFELSFRDERRLPFEGAGAASTWRIELPTHVRAFDYLTISDVIFHINYTAFDAGREFKATRQEELKKNLNKLVEAFGQQGLARVFSLRHEFPNEWHRLRQGHEVTIPITSDRFPYFASVFKPPTITGAGWLTRSPVPAPLTLKEAGTTAGWSEYPAINGLSFAPSSLAGSLPLSIVLSLTGAESAADLLLFIIYTVTIDTIS